MAFDPAAALALLEAFYPDVSPENLELAVREHPDVFPFARIVGTRGDKLTFPDGSLYDVIFGAAGLPGLRRWQMIIPGPSEDVPDPFPIEPGPLERLTLQAIEDFEPTPSFVGLVAPAIANVDGADPALASLRLDVVTHDPGDFDRGIGGELGPGLDALANEQGTPPPDLIGAYIEPGDDNDGWRQSVLRHLPPAESPVEVDLTEPPTNVPDPRDFPDKPLPPELPSV